MKRYAVAILGVLVLAGAYIIWFWTTNIVSGAGALGSAAGAAACGNATALSS